MGDKDKLIVGLFLAASLALTGCGQSAGHEHVDKDGDGYCDVCQASMSHHGGSSGSGYSGSHAASPSSGGLISNGTSAKGGIGSFAAGGAG